VGTRKSEKLEVHEEIEWILAAQKDPTHFEHLFNFYYNDIFNYDWPVAKTTLFITLGCFEKIP
jgi:hypothetical protein